MHLFIVNFLQYFLLFLDDNVDEESVAGVPGVAYKSVAYKKTRVRLKI